VKRKPDFFIVGAPKCGTTAMDHYLAVHPEIFMARKELHHFGADLCFSPQFYRRGSEAYLAEFKAAQGHRRAGESSVWYLFSEQAAAGIKAFNPDARVIIMLRNPVEMLHSLYHQFRFDGNEQLPTFQEALAAENDRRAGQRLSRQHYFAQGLAYRETARFTRQVQRYFQVFGRDRAHVIIYDDFAADPGAVYRRTLEFLDVPPIPLKNGFEAINGNKQIKNPVLRALLNDPWMRRSLIALRPCLPQAVFEALGKTEARLRKMNTVPAARQPLDPELRRSLDREFAPEVERLSALLQRDLTFWSRDAQWQKDIESPGSVREPGTAPMTSAGNAVVAA
jgi:hypothetical protein